MVATRRSLGRYYTIIIVLGLVAFNAILVLPLFWGGYTPYMGSIETAFLSDARFIAESLPHLGWNPLWYMGFPFHLFYNPGLPYVVAGVHSLLGISIASAYRLLIAAFYICVPATLFLFVYYITRRRYPAAVAGLIYSVAPSFCYLISGVRNDAAGFGYAPWQLVVLLRYGEGPHIMGLAFVPIAALGLMHAMRKPSLRSILLAALAISAVALTNFIALFSTAIILVILILSEILVGKGWQKLKAALASAFLAYGLCAFWFNLSFVGGMAAAGGEDGLVSSLANNWSMVFVGFFVAATIAVVLFGGKIERQRILVVGGWLLAFSIIVFGWYEMGVALAPQPNRYMPEMNMAAAMGLGMIADWGRMRMWHMKANWAKLLSRSTSLAILVLFLVCSLPFLQVSYTVTRPNQDVTATSEYQVAQWLAAHVKDERVYATGSHAFWLNVFTNVWQIRGGADGAGINRWWPHVTYQMNTGKNGTIAILWSQALRIKYIVVSSPGSADVYQDYTYPAKFDGLLPKVYNDRGISIYEVPLKQPGLAQVVDLQTYNRLSPIRDAVDSDHLGAYVENVEQSSPVNDYRLVNNDRLEFETDLHGQQSAVLVRMTYHPGWQAYCNGERVPIREDLVGFILIEPQRQGHCRFVIQHEPLWDEWAGYALTAITVVALVVVAFRSSRRRSPPTQTIRETD